MTWNPEALDTLGDTAIGEVLRCWSTFCDRAAALLLAEGRRDLADFEDPLFSSSFAILCEHGLGDLAQEHFLRSLQESFKTNAVLKVSKDINAYLEVPPLSEVNVPDEEGALPMTTKKRSVNASKGVPVYTIVQENWVEEVLSKSLEDICMEKCYQEKCLAVLLQALEISKKVITTNERACEYPLEFNLTLKYQLMVSSVLLTTFPRQFSDILHLYFKQKLEELSNMIDTDPEDACEFEVDDPSFRQQLRRSSEIGEMDIDGCNHESSISMNDNFVKSIGKVVRDLRNLGLASMTEDAYASAIFLLLKAKVHDLAGDDYRNPVLGSIKEWIKAVPLKFLSALLTYLGDSSRKGAGACILKSPLAPSTSYSGGEMPSEGLVRWQLRLEYFAYETLQDLRIGKLFEIIVDYPDSSPAIEDLKHCLEYTGQHSKLVDSFISSLRHRLLTAGASTNDILHQYVSTIKALRTIDPTGVFLEAVGEPIRDYLRGRKDTIKCIVTMLTDGTGGNSSGTGNAGDSLLEELNRDAENQESVDYDDDIISDDKQAWINSERWEPDPVEADPSKGSRNRRKIDILGMIVSLIGSKDQLVSEYRVMLAEKLLSKSDYDIDSEIRTLELLKIHFGESSMQKCEIMLNDLIDSKRTNTNIKASVSAPAVAGSDEVNTNASLDLVDSTIISSNFWPTIQAESLNIPDSVDQLLSDYAKRYHQIKAPRKLLWKKSLGTVKLELQFEDKDVQFTVSPLHAVIIMQFQDKASWTSKNLATAVGVPVDALNRRINYWTSKGILVESVGPDSDDHVFTLVSDMTDANRTGVTSGNSEGLLAMDEEGERTVASVEEQLKKEMIVYEKFIVGMLTNFGSMTLDRIHNTLKMFCIAEPSYDKSLQQLQSFLSGLVTEEKLEMRDGQYYLKK